MKPPFDIAGDLDTPVSAFMKLAAFKPSFLLESVEGGERLALSGPHARPRSHHRQSASSGVCTKGGSGLPSSFASTGEALTSRLSRSKVSPK